MKAFAVSITGKGKLLSAVDGHRFWDTWFYLNAASIGEICNKVKKNGRT